MTLLSRQEFLAQLRTALDQGHGYATGKLGPSEVQRLNFSVAAARVGRDAKLLEALEPNLNFVGLTQAALFPADADFYLRYNEMYGKELGQLDCVGVFPELLESSQPLLEFYRV